MIWKPWAWKPIGCAASPLTTSADFEIDLATRRQVEESSQIRTRRMIVIADAVAGELQAANTSATVRAWMAAAPVI